MTTSFLQSYFNIDYGDGKMGVMEEIKNKAVVKELWDLHAELIEEKEKLIREWNTTGDISYDDRISGIDTAVSRIERRIIVRQGRL